MSDQLIPFEEKERAREDRRSLKDLAQDYTGEGILILMNMLRNEKTSEKVRLGALHLLFDRGWGRAVQTNVSMGSTEDLRVENMNMPQLLSNINQQLEKAQNFVDKFIE